MEQLDASIAREVHRHMVHRDRARVFSSRDYSGSQMASILRSLDALVSSRYHACVLAMAAGVPMVAVGHDLRIEDLFREMGLRDELFMRFDSPDLWTRLSTRVDGLLSSPEAPREALLRGHAMLRERATRNREVLAGFVRRCEWR
jgi:polysaccharide pyruvyl transferase WcaK-like protein